MKNMRRISRSKQMQICSLEVRRRWDIRRSHHHSRRRHSLVGMGSQVEGECAEGDGSSAGGYPG